MNGEQTPYSFVRALANLWLTINLLVLLQFRRADRPAGYFVHLLPVHAHQQTEQSPQEMEVKLQPSEFSALGLTGNHISGHDAGSKSLSPSFRYRYPLPPATTISRAYLTHRTAPHLISSWRISSHPIHLPSRNNGHKARLWARSCARLHSRCVAYRNRASDLDRKLCARSDKNGG